MGWCLEQGLGSEQMQLIVITEDLNLFLRLARCGFGRAEFSQGEWWAWEEHSRVPTHDTPYRRHGCMSRVTWDFRKARHVLEWHRDLHSMPYPHHWQIYHSEYRVSSSWSWRFVTCDNFCLAKNPITWTQWASVSSRFPRSSPAQGSVADMTPAPDPRPDLCLRSPWTHHTGSPGPDCDCIPSRAPAVEKWRDRWRRMTDGSDWQHWQTGHRQRNWSLNGCCGLRWPSPLS